MYEFDFRVTVTSPSKGKLIPTEKLIAIPGAANRIDAIVQMKKKLHKSKEQLHVTLDIQCFKRNIRKERVQVTDSELEKFEREFIYTDLGAVPDLFTRKKDPWDF